MSKFNRPDVRAKSEPTTKVVGQTANHEGGTGFLTDARSELFRLATVNFVGEDTFYESASDRDNRYNELIRTQAVEDFGWLAPMLGWLRLGGNMRSASLVGAAEAVKARLDAGKFDGNAELIDSVLQRADEPGEFLAYWRSRFGRALPKAVRKGVGAATNRLYNERCVTPATLVLTRSLDWVRAGDLEVGDELVGFEEDINPGRGQSAKMKVSVVEKCARVHLDTLKVLTDKGETSVSTDHMFVVSGKWGHRAWKRAGDLSPGDKVIWFGAPWKRDASERSGWLAGFLDGEGYITGGTGKQSGAATVGVGQNVGPTLNYAKQVFKDMGFDFAVGERAAAGNRQDFERLILKGGRYEAMRLLGTVNSVRLEKDRLWVGRGLVSKGPHTQTGHAHATVKEVVHLGVQENVTMATSEKTFISDGFLSHNSYLKWDSAKRGYRFADVLNAVHSAPADDAQRKLRDFILDDRHHGDAKVNEHLPVLAARQRLTSMPVADRRALLKRPDAAQKLREAGMSWESVGGWLQGEMDRTAWEAIAPTMGYMALLRNLRNLDEAGIDNRLARKLTDKIADPDEVAKSRQLPFRFLTAYLNAPSDRWKQALTEAADLALKNIPALDGRTLVLVDTSGSMQKPVSKNSQVSCVMAGALFGVALALRSEGDLYGFASGVFAHRIQRGASLLGETAKFAGRVSEVGMGTEMTKAIRQTYAGHKRVVIVTDMQCFAYGGARMTDGGYAWGVRSSDPIPVPGGVPVYGFNLGGYAPTAVDTRIAGRHELSGLTDATFNQIRNLEMGRDGTYPWMK